MNRLNNILSNYLSLKILFNLLALLNRVDRQKSFNENFR